MRKLLLFTLILLFFGINNSFAGWYGAHSVHYGVGVTSCPGDGLGFGTDATKSLVGPTNLYAPYTGWMTCYYWDGIAPTGTVSYSPSGWTNWGLTVSVTCSDTGGSGCSAATFSKTVSSNGAGSITISDRAGNTRNITYNVTNIDKTKPTVSLIPSTTAWTRSLTLTLQCSDSQSGCKNIYGWYYNGGYSSIRTIISNGLYNGWYYDYAGNYNYGYYNVSNIDRTPPTGTVLSYIPSGWINGNVTVTVSCSDSQSGCSATTFSKTVSSNGAGIITISDRAGNMRNVAYNVTNIDKIPPIGTVSYSPSGWTNGNVSVTVSCSDIGGSGCSTSTYSRIVTSNGAGIITISDRVGNTRNVTFNVTNIDKTPPTILDIGNPNPSNNSNLLAVNSKNFSVTVGPNAGSPITRIEGYFEDQSTVNSYLSMDFSNNGILSVNHSIKNVDLDRGSNGARKYSFKIIKIQDQVGNVWNGSKIFNYNVYANPTLPMITKDAKLSDVNSLKAVNIADGGSHPLTVTLKDVYGNQIVPAPGISRTIDFNFDVIDYSDLNQYSSTINKSAVFLSTPNTPSTYNNITSNRFSNQTSSNGQYPFSFKVYAPTYKTGANDGRQYVNGNFKINNIKVDILGNIGAVNNISLTNAQNIDFQFKPIYYTKFTGPIKTYGFIEGATQSGVINIIKNGTNTTTLNSLNIEFGSGSNKTSPSFDMIYYKTLTQTGIVGEGNPNFTNISNNLNSNYNLKTLITQNGVLANLSSSYLSTHIGYTINLKNVVYNSMVLGKSRYSSASNTNTVTQVGLKVLGKTFSDKKTNITQTQQASNFNILGNISKASLRKDMVFNAYNIIKNAPLSNGNKKIDNLSGTGTNNFNIWNNNDGKKLQNGSILYFGGLNLGNIILDTNGNGLVNSTELVGKKTIIVKGGNLYIKSNIVNKTNNDILGIIVLKDKNGKGGYVYIDPSVTEIDAVIYTDRSVVSYDGTKALDGTTSQYLLRNQLYIKGSVFSYNTIGGSRANPIICPYYITGLCDRIIAQTYDFNYLRRYFLYDSNNDGIIKTDGSDVPVNSGKAHFTSGINRKYPVVIEYNPVVQTGPPPLFYK